MTTTIEEAREHLITTIRKGTKCPVCCQHAQMYRRSINSGMARSLIDLYRAKADLEGWVYIPTATDRRSREEGKLAYWDLIEERQEKRPDGGRAGYWRLTDRGRDFVLNRSTEPKYALVYDGAFLGHEGEQVDIEQALGRKFSYLALMRGDG